MPLLLQIGCIDLASKFFNYPIQVQKHNAFEDLDVQSLLLFSLSLRDFLTLWTVACDRPCLLNTLFSVTPNSVVNCIYFPQGCKTV